METGQVPTMQVTVNDSEIEVPTGISVAQLIAQLKLQNGPMAVEVNLQIVPKPQHQQFILSPHDRLEIVSLVGGG